MPYPSLFLPKRFTSYTLALFILGSASLTMLSGCGDSLPPKAAEPSASSTSPATNAPVSSTPDASPTSGSPTDASSTPNQDAETPAGEESKSPENKTLGDKQLVEQDIIMLASNGVDPFSIAMHIKPIEAKEDDIEALSPYYQALIRISPLITLQVVKVEKPTVDPFAGGLPGMPSAPAVVDPTIAMQEALSSISVNGISYKKTSPMAILALSSKGQAGGTTLFVKKGSRLFANGYNAVVEDITSSTVRISISKERYKVSQTLMIQDIFGFSRSGNTGAIASDPNASSNNAPPPAGGPPPSTGTGSSKDVSSQDIDQIVKDLLN